MKRNAVSLTMAAAMLTGMLGSAPAFAADLSNLPDKVGEGAITATPEMYADTDLSDSYTVNMYLIGDTPNDWDMVEEKINEYLVSRITRAKGCVSMNELVDETNYSACYLRRVFKSYHSISPKQFAQYIRFQILLEKLKTGNMRYDELALECGYYDEAHMMKGFKNYAGITIEQYRKLQEITGRNRI